MIHPSDPPRHLTQSATLQHLPMHLSLCNPVLIHQILSSLPAYSFGIIPVTQCRSSPISVDWLFKRSLKALHTLCSHRGLSRSPPPKERHILPSIGWSKVWLQHKNEESLDIRGVRLFYKQIRIATLTLLWFCQHVPSRALTNGVLTVKTRTKLNLRQLYWWNLSAMRTI